MLRLVNESQNRFPGQKPSLCGQLTAFIFVYLDFGSLELACEIILRPPMFSAPVAGGRTEINAESKISYMDFSVDIA